VPGIAWDLIVKALLYGLRIRKQAVRPTWPQLRKQIPALGLATDYTRVFETIRGLDKEERYSDQEEEEFDTHALGRVVDEVLKFVNDIRKLAEETGKTS